MVSVSSSTNAAWYSNQKSLFSKLDSDSDGKLTKGEYVAGRPKNVSETQASALYGRIDSSNSGAVTETQFDAAKPSAGADSAATSPFSSEAMSVLMLMASQAGAASASDVYAEMDADGDGSLTKAEFTSARPDGVSEEQAAARYASIDTEGTGSITEEQFAESMSVPPGSPPGGMTSQGSASEEEEEETFNALDTNQDGTVSLEEFLAGRPPEVSEDDATALFESLDSENTGSITQEQFVSLGPSEDGQDMSLTGDVGGSQLDQLLALLESMMSGEETSTEAA